MRARPVENTSLSPTELLASVRRVEIRTRSRVRDLLAGRYHSAFKGRGMEFEEVRPYQVGDDVRSIDWNVSARSGAPHVKLFREERELTVVLAVDASGSLGFGSRLRFKRDLVVELAATLAFSAIRNGDRVGLLAFTDRVEAIVPPRRGPRHVLRVIRDLLALQTDGRGTDLANALDELGRVLKRRAIIFVLSDFLDDGWSNAARTLASRHELVPVVVRDPREESLPPTGPIELVDAESGERMLVDAGSRIVRRRFEAFAAERERSLLETFRRMRAEPLLLRSDEDIAAPLQRYFERREAMRTR